MRQDVNLEIGSVQETMLIPLWGRAKFSRLYPEFINDFEAEKIIDDLDYDFANISDAMGEYGGIAYPFECLQNKKSHYFVLFY